MRFVSKITTVLFFMVITIINVHSFSFYLKGNWEYYYKVKKEHFYSFENASNKQEIIEEYDNGMVLVKNSLFFPDLDDSVKYPVIPDENVPEWTLELSASNQQSNEYVRTRAYQIIGESDSLKEATDKLTLWVRNNVTYSYSGYTNAADVIRYGKAYCVGYAEVVVQLLRSVGIPARTISCYIPPGCGWGNNRGGYHAFLEYYFPGVGWLCIDPQSTLHYVDPYHIVEYPHGASRPVEVKRVVETYICDFETEPKKWNLFTRGGYEKAHYPVFVFKISEPNNRINNDGFGFKLIGIDKEVKRSAYGRSYYSDRGLYIHMSKENIIWCRTSPDSPYVTAILNDPIYTKEFEIEFLTVKDGSTLYVHKVDYRGDGTYYVDVDLHDKSNQQTLVIGDGYGNNMAGEYVTVYIDGKGQSVKSDNEGLVYINSDLDVLEIGHNGALYRVCFNDKEEINIPPERTFNNPYSKYAYEHKIDPEKKCVFLCTLYDSENTMSKDTFDVVQLYTMTGERIELNIEDPGLVCYDNIQTGRDYILVLGKDNQYITKKIRYEKNGIKRFVVRVGNERFSRIRIKRPWKIRNTPVEVTLENGVKIQYNCINNIIYVSGSNRDSLQNRFAKKDDITSIL